MKAEVIESESEKVGQEKKQPVEAIERSRERTRKGKEERGKIKSQQKGEGIISEREEQGRSKTEKVEHKTSKRDKRESCETRYQYKE